MIVSITILKEVDIGENGFSDKYTIGYAVMTDSVKLLRWVIPLSWDCNGNCENNRIKFSLEHLKNGVDGITITNEVEKK